MTSQGDAPVSASASSVGCAIARSERAAVLRSLTALLVHQINQPLASIAASGQAALRWLDRPSPDISEAMSSLLRVIEQKDRAANIIGQIRTSVDALAPAQPEIVEVGRVIDAARTALTAELRTAGVRIDVINVLGLVHLRLSAIELELVFTLLFRNAVEAMAAVSEKILVVRCQRIDAGIVADVSDTGPGIELSNVGQVFDLFFTTKPYAEGLGLATCRSLVSLAGGRLTLASSSSRGTTFRIELPFASEDAAIV